RATTGYGTVSFPPTQTCPPQPPWGTLPCPHRRRPTRRRPARSYESTSDRSGGRRLTAAVSSCQSATRFRQRGRVMRKTASGSSGDSHLLRPGHRTATGGEPAALRPEPVHFCLAVSDLREGDVLK